MAPLRISIPTTHTESDGGKEYTAYEVRIEHPFPRTSTSLRKRYSDFAALDAALRSHVGAPPAPLPAKSWLGGFLGLGSTLGSPEQIEKRRHGLEQYLQAIETGEDGRWRVTPAYREFLELGSDKDKKTANLPGAQFGKDRVRDSTDWLDKYQEVKGNLQDARRWLTSREQATAATAQHEAGAHAKKGLVRAGTLLSALEEGLSRLGW
jgi:regulator of vacuolar morphogenesis